MFIDRRNHLIGYIDWIFVLLVTLPMLSVNILFPELGTGRYNLLILFINLSWVFGIFLTKIRQLKFMIVPKSTNLKRSVYVDLILIAIAFLILAMMKSNNHVGLMSETSRISFEGSLEHKLLIIVIFVSAVVQSSRLVTICIILFTAVLTGWKSILIYALVSFIHYKQFSNKKILLPVLYAFFLMFFFTIINFFRQGGKIDNLNFSVFVDFMALIQFYLSYGFVNLALNMNNINTFSYLFPLQFDGDLLSPTWNVYSGLFFLLERLGVLFTCITLAIIRYSVVHTLNDNLGSRFMHYVLLLTTLMLHNTFLLSSTSIWIFGLLLFVMVRLIIVKPV